MQIVNMTTANGDNEKTATPLRFSTMSLEDLFVNLVQLKRTRRGTGGIGYGGGRNSYLYALLWGVFSFLADHKPKAGNFESLVVLTTGR
jgi:hypothetical protein